MDKKPYKQQIETARSTYYSKNIKTNGSRNSVEVQLNFRDDGMLF